MYSYDWTGGKGYRDDTGVLRELAGYCEPANGFSLSFERLRDDGRWMWMIEEIDNTFFEDDDTRVITMGLSKSEAEAKKAVKAAFLKVMNPRLSLVA